MIWNESTPAAPDTAALLAPLLVSDVRAMGGRSLDASCAAEVARGIAEFCLRSGLEVALCGNYLRTLIAQALSRLGYEIATAPAAGFGAEETLSRVPFRDLTPAKWTLFASGVWRPLSGWNAFGGRPAWVLDLWRMALAPADLTEIALLPAVRILLCGCADIWEPCSGRGVLCLAGPRWPASRRRCARPGAWGLADFCRGVMGRLQVERGWERAPEVLAADVRARAGGR
jgi:hypothetical protein